MNAHRWPTPAPVSEPDEPDEQTNEAHLLDTLPPPSGAEDAYSAATRVAPLPEHVLSAMRERPLPTFPSGTRLIAQLPIKPRPPALPQRPLPPPLPVAQSLAPSPGPAPGAYAMVAPSPISQPPDAQIPVTQMPSVAPEAMASVPWAGAMLPAPIEPLAPRRYGLWRSVGVVALFGILGALVALAITLAGR